MRKIALTSHPNFYQVLGALEDRKFFDRNPDFVPHPRSDFDYQIAWAYPPMGGKGAQGETGFFYASCHFDSSGIFDKSSLRGQAFSDSLRSFKFTGKFIDEILSGRYQQSKFYQPSTRVSWDGVVLAGQVPKDRSIATIGEIEDWWDFYTSACAHYRSNLFVKIHPWVKDDVEKRMTAIADRFGCSHGKVGNSIIERCKFVITYNSTYAVDCMLRGVKIAQFAPGYFSECGGVLYTEGSLPDDVPLLADGKKIVEWLAHRYCIANHMPTEKILNLFRWMAENQSFLGIPDEFSYANNLQDVPLR